MIPRNLSRHLVLAVFLAVLALGLSIPAQTENALATRTAIQGMTKGFCASDPGGPVVYFSNNFDAVTKARNKLRTEPLNFAFRNYLVEEYDFKSSSNFPATCRLFETLSQAEARRRQLISDAQQANKQVVEVNWNPSPLVETPQGDDSVTIGPKGPPPTHAFCAVGYQDTMYFSDVFDSAGALLNPKWNDAFSEFLKKRYGIQTEVEATCTIMGTVREAEFNLKARVGGVRANHHKAVETGWKFDPTGTYKPMPKPTPKVDDDPEPAPRPTAPPPTEQSKDLAVKELPVSLAYCQNTPSLNGVFICDCFRRLVYNYRMEHPSGQPEPLASLVAGEKLAWSECIDNIKVGKWVSDRATAQKLDQRAINCITQKFIVGFYAQPKLNRMNALYNESVAACK